MIVYTFDRTLDGLLSAVFDAYFRRQQPEMLAGEGDALPLFCDEIYRVETTDEKARRVWQGLEKRLKSEALKLIAVSWMSEEKDLSTPLFRYIYKVFQDNQPNTKAHQLTLSNPSKKSSQSQPMSGSNVGGGYNFADADVLHVTNTARRVMHEQLRMKQFVRFQKAKDGTYLGVVSPDHNVLPLVIDHFQDRFRDQPWLLYDAKRHYGYYFEPSSEASVKNAPVRITFEDEASVPFSLENGRLADEFLSENDKLFQDLWRTYFKAICIRERLNPRKQLNDMPRRYWKYMTEKQV